MVAVDPLEEDESFAALLSGTPEMVKALIRLLCHEFVGPPKFTLEEAGHGRVGPGINLHVEHGSIGWIFLLSLPGNRTLLRVPPGRESPGVRWDHDPDGALFAKFLRHLLEQFRHYGFMAATSRFLSSSTLESAVRQIGAADDPAAFAAVGNMCRTAVIALARELYQPEMLPEAQPEPKADDAATKLKLVISHSWGGRSERQLGELKKSVESKWGIVSASLHRQHATREEAELGIVETAALYDDLALIVPADFVSRDFQGSAGSVI